MIPPALPRKAKRVFGLELHSWEQLMIAALGIAAFAAVAVVVTTASVVILQRAETARTKNEFEAYKLEAGTQIADANAVGETAKADAAKARAEIAEAAKQTEAAKAEAAEANRKAERERLERLKLEATIAPRSLSLEQQASLAEALKPFAGMKVVISSPPMDGEALGIAEQIRASLIAAGIDVVNMIGRLGHVGGFAFGIHMGGRSGDWRNAALLRTLYDTFDFFRAAR
jgi:CRISPR/Cas system-associated exonuclease Cas4 (RecB family)